MAYLDKERNYIYFTFFEKILNVLGKFEKKKLSVSNEYLTMQKIKISNFRNEKKNKNILFLVKGFFKA